MIYMNYNEHTYNLYDLQWAHLKSIWFTMSTLTIYDLQWAHLNLSFTMSTHKTYRIYNEHTYRPMIYNEQT